MAAAVGNRTFDIVYSMYGRLRDIAPWFVGKTAVCRSQGYAELSWLRGARPVATSWVLSRRGKMRLIGGRRK